MKLPQLSPPRLVGQSNFGMERGGLAVVWFGALGVCPIAGSGFVGQKQARKRAKGFQGALSLHVFPRIKVMSPLLKEVFHQLSYSV